MAYCEACNNLKEDAPNFVVKGVTETECNNLQQNEGLSGASDNEADLNDVLDCLIGAQQEKLPSVNLCDWKEYMNEVMSNMYNMFKALICSDTGQWKHIEIILDALGGDALNMTKFQIKTVVVPEEDFILQVNETNSQMWFSGQALSENFISIPIVDMDSVSGVFASTKVAVDKECIQTVNVQSYQVVGPNLIVNFDAYEYGLTADVPYDMTIDFLIVGKKQYSLV